MNTDATTALNTWAAANGGSWNSYLDRDVAGNTAPGVCGRPWICLLRGGSGRGSWYCHGVDESDAQQRAVRAIESGEAQSAMG